MAFSTRLARIHIAARHSKDVGSCATTPGISRVERERLLSHLVHVGDLRVVSVAEALSNEYASNSAISGEPRA